MMKKKALIKKITQPTFQVIEKFYNDSNYNYEVFLSSLDGIKIIIESFNSTIEEVCDCFKPFILEHDLVVEEDEEGNQTEDFLTEPRSGDPLIIQVKSKGWITPEIEKGFLNSIYYKNLLKPNLKLDNIVLNDVSQNALHILGRSNNPKKWGNSKQGLVMGMVQSGKTVSMLNLIGLGMEAGYNLFIFLAGTKEGLRKQSQIRINEAFSLHNGGYFTDASNKITIFSPTHSQKYSSIKVSGVTKFIPRDSRRTYQPIIIITILKETSNLASMIKDIHEVAKFCESENIDFKNRYKAMILDDESDNASLNLSAKEIKGINKKLVDLRKAIPLNCYVGYTATPQGCLAAQTNSTVGYPKDFIWLLEPLKVPGDPLSTVSYLGLNEFFIRYENDIIKSLSPNSWPHHRKGLKGNKLGVYNPLTKKIEEKANLNALEDAFAAALKGVKIKMPQEFIDAMIEFIIGCGIRWYRFHNSKNAGQEIPDIKIIKRTFPYHAMIYNLSLTTANQGVMMEVFNKCWNFVNTEYSNWKNKKASRFEKLWAEQIAKSHKLKPTEPLGKLNEIRKFMDFAISISSESILGSNQFIYLLNSTDEGDVLNYDDDDLSKRIKKCAIFIGGNILSRGLTIENLSVSVFARSQVSSLGDTNLQMCRWFGHKKKEIDILTLYIMDETRGLFKDISRCDEALRSSIKKCIVDGLSPEKVLIELWSSSLFSVTSNLKARLLRKENNSAISYTGKARDLREPFCSYNVNELKENIRLIDDYEKNIKFQKKQLNHLNRGDLYIGVEIDDLLTLLHKLLISKESLFVSPKSYAEYLEEWDKGYKNKLIKKPVPTINVAFMGGLDKKTKRRHVGGRQREYDALSTPIILSEVKEKFKARIGSLFGGSQKNAANVYKGDKFFDQNQIWHTKNINTPIYDRSESENSILFLFYKLNPNYLGKFNIKGKKHKVTLVKSDSGYVNIESIVTFAVITPLGGPSYQIHINKIIDPTK